MIHIEDLSQNGVYDEEFPVEMEKNIFRYLEEGKEKELSLIHILRLSVSQDCRVQDVPSLQCLYLVRAMEAIFPVNFISREKK